MLVFNYAPNTRFVPTPSADETAFEMGDSDIISREIHHRVKNTLALLIALLHQDFRAADSSGVAKAIARYERRILAFRDLYRSLSVGGEEGDVAVGRYVEDLCQALAVAVLEPIGIRCEANVDEGFLDAARCERLGLMIAELVMNSAKHAFPKHGRGTVRVEAVRSRDGWRCSVSDDGVGAEGATSGIGGRILQGLARAARAQTTTTFLREGRAVTIFLPD